MLARVQSFILKGIDATPCEIEVDAQEAGLPREAVVGLASTVVRESLERVKSAVSNAGYRFPFGKVIISLAPADVRKDEPVYDLPIAIAAMIADGTIPPRARTRREAAKTTGGTPVPLNLHTTGAAPAPHEASAASGDAVTAPADAATFMIAGELALDGRIRPIRGAIAMAMLARERGFRGIIVPADNAAEAAVVSGIDVLGVRTLTEVVGLLTGNLDPQPHEPVDIGALIESATAEIDFAEVRGQESVKRAITVAACGSHNLLRL